MDRLKSLWERVKQLKPYRANTRYNQVRGNLLSSGIAYYGFFSIFPAFALAAAGFGILLKNQPELLDAVAKALNTALPGFVKTADNPDGLVELQAPAVSLLTIGGIIALVTLILSGAGWMSSYRNGIRGALGAVGEPGNAVTAKARDLAVFAGFGVAFLLSAVLTTAVGALTGLVSELTQLTISPGVITALGLLVGALVDFLIMMMMLRGLSGLKLPYGVVAQASLVAAVLLGVVKYFGVQLIANATKSPLLGSVALVVGLLFWLNLIARIVLLAACWAYLDTDPAIVARANAGKAAAEDTPEEAEVEEPLPVVVSRVAPEIPQRVLHQAEPRQTRERDRLSLFTGAVIGAGAALVVAPIARWVRRR